jgi:hypothetical protein
MTPTDYPIAVPLASSGYARFAWSELSARPLRDRSHSAVRLTLVGGSR